MSTKGKKKQEDVKPAEVQEEKALPQLQEESEVEVVSQELQEPAVKEKKVKQIKEVKVVFPNTTYFIERCEAKEVISLSVEQFELLKTTKLSYKVV